MVPQVREAIAGLRLPDIEAGDSPRELIVLFIHIEILNASPIWLEHTMWKLVELFTNLDLAQLSGIVDNDAVLAFDPGSWDGTTASLGDLTDSTALF